MKSTLVAAILYICILSIHSPAQELTPVQPIDTSLYLVQLYTPEFVFKQTLNFSPFSFGIREQFPNHLYQSTLYAPASFAWELQNNTIDIASPWKLQLAKENENRTWSIVFGSVGTGGALYIAYRHVKKYGFW